MNRKTFIISFMLSAMTAVPAFSAARCEEHGDRRPYPLFTFGVESSYVFTFLNRSHFNFISADGDRRDERVLTTGAISNGQFLVHGGINVSPKVNLSLYAGYCGVFRHERMIPVSLRVSWYSGDDPMRNRWIVFCSAGAGFNDIRNPWKLSAEGKLGGGYRISLNRSVKLDLVFAFQEVYTHPRAYESDAGNYVPQERLRRNDAYISAFALGIALVF